MSLDPRTKYKKYKDGQLVMYKYGSLGIIKSSYFNKTHNERLYEVNWLYITDREYNALHYSLYFKEFEITWMVKKLKSYRVSNGI